MAKVLSTIPNVKRRAPGTIVPIQTDEDRAKKKDQQAASYERAKAKKKEVHDPKFFNVKEHSNWLR